MNIDMTIPFFLSARPVAEAAAVSERRKPQRTVEGLSAP
jgi:hypothetical protein